MNAQTEYALWMNSVEVAAAVIVGLWLGLLAVEQVIRAPTRIAVLVARARLCRAKRSRNRAIRELVSLDRRYRGQRFPPRVARRWDVLAKRQERLAREQYEREQAGPQ